MEMRNMSYLLFGSKRRRQNKNNPLLTQLHQKRVVKVLSNAREKRQAIAKDILFLSNCRLRRFTFSRR